MEKTHIERRVCKEASAPAMAQLMAGAFRTDGFRELLVSHDGKVAGTDAAQCRFGAVADQLKLISRGTKKIVVVIDNQPAFFNGRKFTPNKPDVVEKAITDALAHSDKLALIYVVE